MLIIRHRYNGDSQGLCAGDDRPVELHYYPDPILRSRAEAVTAFDQALSDLEQEMVQTMRAHDGLGLAAQQVGVVQRLAIISPDGKAGRETALVNPEMIASEGWVEAEEGCLSFPGIYVKIGRFLRVRIRYSDLQDTAQEMEAEGLLARAIQHELDHLDGRLILDRMSSVQRMAQRRRLHELQEGYARRMNRTETGSEAAR